MTAIDRAYNEKRSFIRMKINTPVEVKVAGNRLQGVCKDLSGSGLLVETREEVALGTDVEVYIDQKGANLDDKWHHLLHTVS